MERQIELKKKYNVTLSGSTIQVLSVALSKVPITGQEAMAIVAAQQELSEFVEVAEPEETKSKKE